MMEDDVIKKRIVNKNNVLRGFSSLGAALVGKIAIATAACWPIILINNTRQGYVLRNTLKPAGYFFLGLGR